MSLPSTISSSDPATSPPGEGIDQLHERALNTTRHGTDTAPTQTVLDSDDDFNPTVLSDTPENSDMFEESRPVANIAETSARDTFSTGDLPHRIAPSLEHRPRNQPRTAGSTYETAIDISSSPPIPSRVDPLPRSPATLSRRVSQRSSYIGDEYPAPPRGPPSSTSVFNLDMPQTNWLGNSPGRAGGLASGRRLSRDAPDVPGARGGYRFPDAIPNYDGASDILGDRYPPRRRPSSMLVPNSPRSLVDGLEQIIYDTSPTSGRRLSGGSPRYYSDVSGPPRRQSSGIHDASPRNRSFSSRHSGESSNSFGPGSHQRYSSMSMPRWQPNAEGPSRSRRDRVSLPASNETSRNTTLDDIFQDVSLPRWQPDSEASSCPICETIFSFWHRKHHCRKCGRVVCAACSPHRITIPRQYIVRPPEASTTPPPGLSPTSGSNVVDLTGDDSVMSSSGLNPALGGGEEVRLCNPCVPDPNPNPLGYEALRPHGHRSTHSLSSTMGNSWTTDTRSSRQGRLTVGANDRPSGLGVIRQEVHRTLQSLSAERDAGQSTSTYPIFNPPQQVQRPSAVSERDLCPICGNRFPPLDEDHPLESREAHIRQCIDGYGASRASPVSSVSAEQGPPPQSPSIARMLAFTATEKDCLGDDGEVAECTICMEDYEVGQVLARLECLCKFHKDCIVDWFGRKAECPVHKVS